MPRTNYVVAWNNLKEITRWIINAGAPSISPTTVLFVMLILEDNPADFDHLDQLERTLKALEEK